MSHAQAEVRGASHQPRWQMIVVVLVIALIATGGWWIFQNTSATGITLAPSAGIAVSADARAEAALPVAAPAANAAAVPNATSQLETAAAPAETLAPAGAVVAIAGVAGVKGAALWGDDGNLVATLESGANLNATARTVNGTWLWVETAAGAGWVQAGDVIAYGLQQLETGLVPGAVAAAAENAGATHTAAFQETVVTADAGETAAALEDETTAASTPADPALLVSVTSASMVARVSTTDVRLNVRSGPGTTYSVVAKADPGAEFIVLGRSAAGDWLLLQLGDDASDAGWVAAEYVELSGDVEVLPISDAVDSV